MGYKDMVLGTLTQTAIDERNNTYFKMAQEVEEVYRKAKAFDEIVNAVDESANSYEWVARIKLEGLKYQKLERGSDE